jgi:hypothetical protein
MGAHEALVGMKEDTRKPAPRMVSLRPAPMPGDVLLSRPAARADLYAISVVPAQGDLLAVRHAEAIERACELARGLAVDVWYTCDHTHFARIATHRA